MSEMDSRSKRLKTLAKKAIKYFVPEDYIYMCRRKLYERKNRNAMQSVEKILKEKDPDLVWAFNAGNTFTGNPKWLFLYVTKYRKDITAYWICDRKDTVESLKKMGYLAIKFGTKEAEMVKKHTGVFVVENVKESIPIDMENVKMLNLFHGVGCKSIERKVNFGFLDMRIAQKYITNNQFYRNNQLFLVTSPLMERHFKEQCGIDDDKVIRAGYPRCLYQKYYDQVATFPHDILGQKGLPKDTKIAVYAPTYRDKSQQNFFSVALPDMPRLVEKLEQQSMLLIFKMHPLMESDVQYIEAKRIYKDCPYILFWDNSKDFYEIMNQVELAIIDYSSIFYDMLSAGIPYYIRYIFDYGQEDTIRDLVFDYKEMTFGQICNDFEELLNALDHYKEDYGEEKQRVNDLFWEYAGEDSFEKIVNQTLEFQIPKRDLPTLYSFDVFDTLFSRRVLNPHGIFYYVQNKIEHMGVPFPDFLRMNYPDIRIFCEANVREFHVKGLEYREDGRREITFDEIYDRMQEIYGITDEQKKLLQEWELEAELLNVIPLSERISYVKELVQQGKNVVLISDMYLSKETVYRMLEKADPVLAKLPLFLSSEYGIQKSTKLLYLEVYRSFPMYDFKNWIHYGDNAHADGKMPYQLGIKSLVHEIPRFNEYEKNLVREIGTYDSYLVAAAMARFRFKHALEKEYYAYAYASLYFVPYVNWAVKDALKRGIKCLYFISRDGYQLKRIADTLIRMKHYPIKTKYIYGSRRAWRVPSFITEIDREFFGEFGNFVGVNSFGHLLKAMHIDEETFMEMFPDKKNLKKTKNISKKQKDAFVKELENSQEYHEYLLKKAAQEREIVIDYFKQEIDFNEKSAYVEYWGRGYTQDCFARLVQFAAGKEMNVPYYYARSIYPTQGHYVRYNFTSNNTSLIFVEALFANIPYKSIASYEYENGRVVPVIEEINCDTALFHAMEKCLPQFCEDVYGNELLDEDTLDRTLYDYGLVYYRDTQDDPVIVNNLGKLVDAVGTYGKKAEFAPEFTMADMKKIGRGAAVGSFTKSAKISLERSQPEVVEEFDQIFQREYDTIQRKTVANQRLKPPEMRANESISKRNDRLKLDAQQLQKRYDQKCARGIVSNRAVLLNATGRILKTEFWSLRKELVKRDFEVKDVRCEGMKISENGLYLLATSAYIFVSKPTELISLLKWRSETKVVQICDFTFAFTKIGFAKAYKLQQEQTYQRMLYDCQYDLLPAASNELKNILGEAYHIEEPDTVQVLGNCSTDVYFDEDFLNRAKKNVYKHFPEAQQKKVIFYMPQHRYRDDRRTLVDVLDFEYMASKLQDEYVVIMHTNAPMKWDWYKIPRKLHHFVRDLTGEVSLREMMVVADVIVGDYRHSFFEAPLTGKPVFCTAHDFAKFSRNAQVYYRYFDVMPGQMVDGTRDLVEQLQQLEQYDGACAKRFKEIYLALCDGSSAQRIADYIIGEMN